MGIFSDILGGVVGGVGEVIAGREQADAIRDATRANLQPFTQQGQQANQFLADFLMGTGGAEQLNRFADTTGMNFLREQGRRAIGGQQAAMGKLGSGATGKALAQFGQDLASTRMGDFLSNIQGLAGRGASTGAAGVTALGGAAEAEAAGQRGGLSVIGDLLGSIF